VRTGETVARFSGDEFVFIIRDVHGAQDAINAAKRLQALLEEPVRCDSQELIVTGSVGIVIPDADADAATVLRDADAAVYQAKEDGRNRCSIFDETIHHRSVARLNVEGDLRQALVRNEFEVYYQPIIEPVTGRPMGAEALVRWRHPVRGLVSPLDFIAVAEDTGLIKPIGRWVFEQAVAQLAAWDAEKDGPRLDLLAVNLSARQLDDAETSDIVRGVLNRCGTAPKRVCVEVTESVVMHDSASTRRSLAAFKNLGLKVAIDDFGTGYSSLAYLHTLPVTTVKIDRSFVERLGGEDDSTAVVRAVIEMTHAIGLSVVAEGVSSERLWELISMMGCDSAQGFVWSPPLPATEFATWWLRSEHRAGPVPTVA
jgi:EAL domain-containing protein (putative c-di-GMP-specific phosphodiesterase class I)